MLARFMEQVVTFLRRTGFSQALLAKPANQSADEEEQCELDGIEAGIDFHREIRRHEEKLCNQRGKKSREKARTKSAIPSTQTDWQNEDQVGNITLKHW